MRYGTAFLGFLLVATVAMAEPRIEVVGKDTIDFGKYNAWEKRVARYTIRNAGDKLLKIIKVRKTCGCASAVCDKKELKPGEQATVEVIILPSSIFHLYSKNTFVESNDPATRFLKLTVAGNAIPLIEAKPKDFVYAGRLKAKKPWDYTFQLSATGQPVQLGKPKVESNFPVDVSLSPTNQAASAFTLGVTLKPVAESGDWDCKIEVPIVSPTNHVPLKLGVSAKLGAQLAALPGIAYMPVSDGPLTKRFSFRVLGQRSRVLNPKELRCPEDEGVKCQVAQDRNGRGLSVICTLSPEFTKRLYADEKLPLVFSVPNAASAKIVCKIRK